MAAAFKNREESVDARDNGVGADFMRRRRVGLPARYGWIT
jgi:hypothetical protein